MLENDAIKQLLLAEYPTLSHRERGLITWNYTMDLYQKISHLTRNGLVVRDGVTDWYFDRILPLFIEQGFALFVVAFSVSREKNETLLRERGDTETVSVDLLLNQIDEHAVHIKRFREAYTPDIVLAEENLFDHDSVLRLLKIKLTSLPPSE